MRKKQGKREKIMKAAKELLTRQGFHGAPMSMIAEKAGVGAGTIYNYFESKDVLIREIFLAIERDIIEHISLDAAPLDGTREKFVRLWTSLLGYLVSHADNFRYLEQFHNSPFGVSLRRDRLDGKNDEPRVFSDLMREGQSSGEVRLMPIPVLCAIAFGPILMLARDQALGFLSLDAATISQCAEACWDSLKK